VQLNYLKYFQLIAASPNYLKRKAQATGVTDSNILMNGLLSICLKTSLFLELNVDVKITINYFRKKLGQSLTLLKDGVDIF